MKAGLLPSFRSLIGAVLAVAGDLDADFIAEDQPDIDCSLFEDAGGAPRVLFVGNRADGAREAIVSLPPGITLRDPFGATIAADGVARVDLAANQTRMFVL